MSGQHFLETIKKRKEKLYEYALNWASSNNYPIKEAENRMYVAVECNKQIRLLDKDAMDRIIDIWMTTLKAGTHSISLQLGLNI